MSKPSLKQATTYLKTPNKDLQALFVKIEKLDRLQQQLKHYLEPDLIKLCQVANVIGNKLIIMTANGTVATILRIQSADLLKKFKENPILAPIQQIECKASPKLTYASNRLADRKFHRVQLLSAEAADIVQEIAEGLDDPLKTIMQRIAKRRDLPPSPRPLYVSSHCKKLPNR